MECKNFNCENCNPTIFNPEYYTKCEYCSKRPVAVYKGQTMGPSEITNKNIKRGIAGV